MNRIATLLAGIAALTVFATVAATVAKRRMAADGAIFTMGGGACRRANRSIVRTIDGSADHL